MVKSPVKVAVRTRPTASFASQNIQIDLDKKTIDVHIPRDSSQGIINNQQEDWKFQFNEILHNSSQEAVYDSMSRQLVQSVVQGYNGTILAYGQTGAGKTYTMSGTANNYKYRGVIPRAVAQVFHEIQNKLEQAITVRVSFVEIYNELLYDLISPIPPSEQTGSISIQDDALGGVHVKGLSMTICTSEEEALNLLFEGETNRTIAEHKLNKSSTRSHCIYTLHIEARSRVESNEKVISSKLNLVDLAGSERTKKTGSEGLTLTEANYINKSLSYLEQVVVALSAKERDYVPYRQSKLTHILKDSIGGNSMTLMIANIWPEVTHIEETISTLRFAMRMMNVSNEAVVNIQLDPTQLIKRYEREIREFKQELAMHDTLANRGRIAYDPYNSEQQYEVQKQVESYLDGSLDDFQIESLRQVREVMIQMRNTYHKVLARFGASDFRLGDEQAKTSRHPTLVSRTQHAEKDEQHSEEGGVGEEENTYGFGIGRANPRARPLDSSIIDPKREFLQEEDEAEDRQKTVEKTLPKSTEIRPAVVITVDKNQAFMEFKNTEGRDIDLSLAQNKAELKARKLAIRTVTEEINQLGKRIEDAKERIDEIRAARGDQDEDVIDEEEYSLIKALKELKRGFKGKFEDLRRSKAEAQEITQAIDQARHRLIDEFDTWVEGKYGSAAPKGADISGVSDPEAKPGLDDIDPDAFAYIKAKKNVDTLHRAKKQLMQQRK